MVLRHPTREYQPDRASRTARRTATRPADHTPTTTQRQMREISQPPLDTRPSISAALRCDGLRVLGARRRVRLGAGVEGLWRCVLACVRLIAFFMRRSRSLLSRSIFAIVVFRLLFDAIRMSFRVAVRRVDLSGGAGAVEQAALALAALVRPIPARAAAAAPAGRVRLAGCTALRSGLRVRCARPTRRVRHARARRSASRRDRVPAGEAVVCRGRERVVIVVPGLAERRQREPGEVAGAVVVPKDRRPKKWQSELTEKVA